MSPPVVRVNTIVQASEKPIDLISSVFVLAEFIIGINRLTVLINMSKFNKIISSLYTIVVYATVIGIALLLSGFYLNILSLFEYTFYVIISIISSKRLSQYYAELRRFDAEAGCEFKIIQGSKRNLVFTVCVVVLTLTFFIVCQMFNLDDIILHYIPVNLTHVIELHFYGHLLSLLVLRMRVINLYMELSLRNHRETVEVTNYPIVINKSNDKSNYQILKLMKLYEIIVRAYDLLIDAIQWMMVVVLTFSFMVILMFFYNSSSAIILDSKPWIEIITGTGVALLGMVALFAPCICSDQLRNEVLKFRELLAYRLYDNEIDKESRRAARSLIEVTGTRNLAFSLLRMLNIDVSLPFKFIGLMITYLIILLQFQKVTNL